MKVHWEDFEADVLECEDCHTDLYSGINYEPEHGEVCDRCQDIRDMEAGHRWETELIHRLRRGLDIEATGRPTYYSGVTWDDLRQNPYMVLLPGDSAGRW